MINDIKLTSAMRNSLLNHQQIKDLTATVEKRLATGKKVNDILDGPVEYFKAKGLYDKADDLLKRKEGIAQGISVLKGAQNGITHASVILDQIKGLAEEARNASAAKKQKLQDQAQKLMREYDKILKDSSMNGTNLIYNEPNIGGSHVQNVPLSGSGHAMSIWGDDDYVYVAGESEFVSVYEIDDITGELTLTYYGGTQNSYDVWGDETHLYTVSQSNRLYLHEINRSDGTLSYTTYYTLGSSVDLTDVWGDDKFLYVANDTGGNNAEIIVLERHEDGTLTELDRQDISAVTTPAGSTGPAGIFTDGNHLYFNTTRDGVHVYDVDPNTGQLTWLDERDTFDAHEIKGDGVNLLVADGGNDVRSMRFDEATNTLVQIDADDLNDNVYSIALDGTYYYGATLTDGVEIYTVDDAGQITSVGAMSPPTVSANTRIDIWANGTHVYLANHENGIDVFDVRTNGFQMEVEFSDDTSQTIYGTNLNSYNLGIQAPTIDFGSAKHIDGFLERLDQAIAKTDTAAASYATDFALLQTRLELTEDLVNTHEEAGDKLTLADLEEESANRLALETREQLSLFSMTNSHQSVQNLIDILFGGGS